MDDAELDLGLREDGSDRLGEARPPVYGGDQHVMDAAVLELREHAEPELCPLSFADPEAQKLLFAGQGESQGPGDGLSSFSWRWALSLDPHLASQPRPAPPMAPSAGRGVKRRRGQAALRPPLPNDRPSLAIPLRYRYPPRTEPIVVAIMLPLRRQPHLGIRS